MLKRTNKIPHIKTWPGVYHIEAAVLAQSESLTCARQFAEGRDWGRLEGRAPLASHAGCSRPGCGSPSVECIHCGRRSLEDTSHWLPCICKRGGLGVVPERV